MDLLIVGNPCSYHLGAHLANAAGTLALQSKIIDLNEAFSGSWLATKWSWWMRRRIPNRFDQFGERVLEMAREFRPRFLLTTGLAPVSSNVLAQIAALGVRRLNYLTDDPWNPAVRCDWFLESLRQYDDVFSPRLANLGDLRSHGCRSVHYLPFGYAPEIHFSDPRQDDSREDDVPDVLFVGGADRDRLAWIEALIGAGFRVALHGGKWDRYPSTRSAFRGIAGPAELRKATRQARVTLCLVRRANRDGHVMRSLEIPALGGCMLAERTEEHEALFGADGECVRYFHDVADMVTKTRWLLENPAERNRLSCSAWRRITGGQHTYAARLREILDECAS